MIQKVRLVQKLISSRMWIELGFYIACDFLVYYFGKRKKVKEVYNTEEKPTRRKRKYTKRTPKKEE